MKNPVTIHLVKKSRRDDPRISTDGVRIIPANQLPEGHVPGKLVNHRSRRRLLEVVRAIVSREARENMMVAEQPYKNPNQGRKR